MNRCLRCTLLVACLTMGAITSSLAGPPDPVTGLTLRETLEKGLKARRPVEFRYIANISRMVDRGQIPESMVRSTFGWARKRSDRSLQQFQFALYERARKQGYRVPQQ